jgi:hypothetical protein
MDRPSNWPEMSPEQYRRFLDQHVTNRSEEDLYDEYLHFSLEERLARTTREAWAFMENEKKRAHERKDVDGGAVQAILLKAYYRRFYRTIIYGVFSVVSFIAIIASGNYWLLGLWAVVGLLMYYQWVKK